MKVLVTGGAGFIGSHLVDHYIGMGNEVVVIDNLSTGSLKRIHPKAKFIKMNLSDPNLRNFICKEKPDLINHHAAQIDVRVSVNEPIHDLDINLRNTVCLLEYAAEAKVKKVIFASSGGAVYGETARIPVSERSCCNPVSPYGINKWAAEQYISFFAERYGFSWSILRYSNVYGPRQSVQGEAGVIPIFINRLRKGLAPIIYGNGEQVRDFIHVQDVVAANLLVSHIDRAYKGIFNVGTGRGTSLNQLVELLFTLFSFPINPLYEIAKPGDIKWNILSNAKLRSFGWKPAIRIEEGLRQLVTMEGLLNE